MLGVRPRRFLVLPLALGLVLVFGSASSAEGPTIEAAGGAYGYYWSPSSAQTTAGGTVTFKSPSASVPHGVTWSGGPATPVCSGVPIDAAKTNWSGTCTFPQAGTYSFYCTVHPTEMKGTVAASATAGGESPNPGTSPPPPSTEPTGSPLQGPAFRALKLPTSQHGGAVRGVLLLSSAAAGGRLQVDLLMKRSLLPDAARVGKVRVGRLVRSGLKEGRLPFAVTLRQVTRRALRERNRLPLRVRLTIAAPGAKTLVLNRSVTVHG